MTTVKNQSSNTNWDESTDLYFSQVKNHPLLGREEEMDLSRRIQEGDESARQELIQGNLRLVITIAKQYGNRGLTLIDLIQEGNLGLIHAAQKYDFRHQVRFSTYAAWWIKQAITRALDNKQRAIRLPHRKEEALRTIQRVYNRLSQELMRTPSLDEITREVGMPREEVVTIMSIGQGMVSFDAEFSEEANSLYDLVQDVTYSPEAIMAQKNLQDDINAMLTQLETRERAVIVYRYALGGTEKLTLKSISDRLGISPETVRQIEMRAIRKMKDYGHSQDLGA